MIVGDRTVGRKDATEREGEWRRGEVGRLLYVIVKKEEWREQLSL